MTDEEKELMRDLIFNDAATKIESLQNTIKEKDIEIERLRTILGQLNAEHNSALETLKSQCREISYLNAEVKHMQIDVLNKAKSRISDRESFIQAYIVDGCLTIDDMYTEIDELIKELKNEQQ